jgi:prolyl oligopeptidase
MSKLDLNKCSDEFLWLEELHSKKSLDWVDGQNLRTLKAWGQGQQFTELETGALKILDSPDRLTLGPVLAGQVFHVWQDQKNPVGLFRKTAVDSLNQNPGWEIILDLDEYSKSKGVETFLNHWYLLENSSRCLLFFSPQGKDSCEIREWDLEKNQFIENGFYSELAKDDMAWVDENHVLWASSQKPTHTGYPSRLYSWKRNQEPQLILEVPSSSMAVWPLVLKDNEKKPHIFVIHSLNWNETEIFLYQDKKLVKTGLPARNRLYGFYKDRMVIWIDKAWGSFKGDSVLIAKKESHWTNLLPEDFESVFEPNEKKSFEQMSLSQNGIAIHYIENLAHQIELWTDQVKQKILIPDAVSVSNMHSSIDKKHLYAYFQGFSQPAAWMEWESTGWKLIQKSKGHFNTEDVESRQEWATSRDGTKVPYWIVYDKKFQFPLPALQYGYGGFQSSLFPSYNPSVGAFWIEKGGLYIFTQIRGGAELGLNWFHSARLENKQKSYDDFIAISEDVIAKGYTTTKCLGIHGRSNGGLLVGATLMQRPDLYGAAIIEVPLLDMIRYVELPPGSSWIGEYGDPRDPKFYEIIKKYSPYQNISRDQDYPPTMIRTARSDDRVHPSHARKMAARMQSYGKEKTWFFEEELGGHKSTPVKVKALQLALNFHFLWKNLGQSTSERK